MMQRTAHWLVGMAILSISTASPAQPMDQALCLKIHIPWMNYFAPLTGSNINEQDIATAKQKLTDARPDMTPGLQAALDDLIVANEALADNPEDMLDSGHPLNNGEADRLWNAYEEEFGAACPEFSS